LARLTQGALELLIRNRLGTFDHSDLDLWPSDPWIKCFFCYPGWMFGPSLRRVGQGNLLVINRKQFWHIWPWWPWPLWPQNQ